MNAEGHPPREWEALVSGAVLGADRSLGVASVGARAWMVASPSATEPAVRLLNDAATLSVYEIAGRAGESVQAAAPTLLSTSEPTCGKESGAHLQSVLFGDRGEVLLEWCNAAIAAGLSAPPEFVPALLGRAASTSDHGLRTALVHVSGARGRWLAELNPEWGVTQVVQASVKELMVVWEASDKGERITALKAIRRTAPEKARELVQAVWDTETAADRAGFLGVMSEGVSLQDESWLEALLDDRSKQVRAAVTRLLSLIPESGMAKRMAWRVDSWIDLPQAREKKQKDSATIEFMPPDELDPSAVRDGLQMKSVGGLGPKAELLRGIASRAPLSAWANRGGDAAAWLDAARKSDWADALCRGWIEAAALQRDAEWAEVVLLRLLDDATSHDELQRAQITQLMDALSFESAERITLNAVANRGLVERPRVVEAVLNACDFGWGEELSRAVAGAVRERLAAKEAVYDTFLRQILRLSAVRIDPSVTEEVGQMWTESQDHWSANLGELVHDAIGTVRLRRDMLAALKNSPAQ